jgi:hypothetical protein
MNLADAWFFVRGIPTADDRLALEGVRELATERCGQYLEHLPRSLQNLTFLGDGKGNQSIRFAVPSGLLHLTFGRLFNQRLDHLTLPNSLQSLTFGFSFDQSLEHVTLPSNLQSLTFGCLFDQSLENVTSKLDFWRAVQPQSGASKLAEQPRKSNFWRAV